MRSSIIASILAFSASQVAAQYYSNQSAPFNLVLLSKNSTLNGTGLTSCHEGAAIEGLCVGGPVNTYSGQYYFNTSSVPDVNTTGLLTWELHGGNFNLSSPMDFSYNPASNVAVPLFTPSETGTNVAFDERNRMNLQQYLDDTKPLPNYAVKPLYRWYVCTTYAGYLYQTLAWVMGDGKPENPTCQKVDVVRVFI